MISDCTPTTCESAVCFSAEIFFSGVCRNCLLSCFLLCRRMPHKAQLWEWITKGNTRIKCAQMRANACLSTRFLTRVCAKIVRAFCVCVGRLSLTCTVHVNTCMKWCSQLHLEQFLPSTIHTLYLGVFRQMPSIQQSNNTNITGTYTCTLYMHMYICIHSDKIFHVPCSLWLVSHTPLSCSSLWWHNQHPPRQEIQWTHNLDAAGWYDL